MKYIIYGFFILGICAFFTIDSQAENNDRMESNLPSNTVKEIATLAGGCFWCMEAMFSELQGVEKVESGYSGGSIPDPSYEQVCTGTTGHAEAVQITFDPKAISFRELLEVFFAIHDPTTLNRQGADVGTQYRSVILYHTHDQKRIAELVITELTTAKVWSKLIVTEVTPFTAFYRTEEYHQEYYKRNPWQAYCQAVISPKITKFRKQFKAKLKK